MTIVDEYPSKNKKKYLDTLNDAAVSANEINREIKNNIGKLKKDLNLMLIDLNGSLSREQIKKFTNDENLLDYFSKFNKVIDEIINVSIDKLVEAFEKKEKHLNDFTFTLFGRTKVGKSTIREALTNGDGSTIGKGDQRTTRDIGSYSWNNLRIVDTPGIAAYDGDEDVEIAESLISETDVIIFLVMSDSIQESEFKKLFELKSQNKPILIVLNVCQALDDELDLEDFLTESKQLLSFEGQQGHINRINKSFVYYFKDYKPNITFIHALAAFKANQTSDIDLKKQLIEASGIPVLKRKLENYVINKGKFKRLQSFLDDYVYYLNQTEINLKSYYYELKPRYKFLQNKHADLVKWFDNFIQTKNSEIEDRAKSFFSRPFNEYSYFVEENISKENFSTLWENKMSSYNIDRKAKEYIEEIYAELNDYLSEFSENLKFDAQNINFDRLKEVQLDTEKLGYGKRVVRWAGVGTSALMGLAVINIWNPGGWVLAGLGIGTYFIDKAWTWFFGDDKQNFEEKKQLQKNKIFKSLEHSQRKLQGNIKNWFYKEITKNISKNVKNEMYDFLKTFNKFIKHCDDIIYFLEKEMFLINKRLISELIESTFQKKLENEILSIYRNQGKFTKVLISGKVPFNGRDLTELSDLFGEKIIFSSKDNIIDSFLTLIYPIKLSVESLNYDEKLKKLTVICPKNIAPALIGKNGSNIQNIQRALNIDIKVIK